MGARVRWSALAWGAVVLLGIGVAAAQGPKPAGKPAGKPPAAASAASSTAPPLPSPAGSGALPPDAAKPAPPPPQAEVAPIPPAFQPPEQDPAPATAAPLPPQGPPNIVWPSPLGPSATADRQEPEAPAPKPWTTRDLSKDFWQIGLGLRHSWVRDSGFDPYATNDSLLHGSVFATRSLFVRSNFGVGAGLIFEAGGRSAQARGAEASLSVYRPGAILEARYNVVRNLYLGVRLVPQAVYTELRLQEASAPATMGQNDWRFGLDATAHVGWNVLRMLGVRATIPEWWLLADVGYGYTQRKEMSLKPQLDDSDPRSNERLNLGKMATSGLMMRVALAVHF